MKWMREVTEWANGMQCNHTYLLDGDKCWAYIKQGTDECKEFAQPLKLDLRGRKFEFVKEHKVKKPKANTKTVKGSKGETYTVDLDLGTCTCAGFRFRGKCRHLEELGIGG